MSTEIQELVDFLKPNTHPNLQQIAVETILGLTENVEYVSSILQHPNVVAYLFNLLQTDRKAAQILVNLSSSSIDGETLVQNYLPYVPNVLDEIFNESSEITTESCMILSNLTRHDSEPVPVTIIKYLTNKPNWLRAVTDLKYNCKGCSLDYFLTSLGNITQQQQGRDFILHNPKHCYLEQLLGFLKYQESTTRRLGIAAMLKNCSFDVNCHDWLVDVDGVDLIPTLLLPLAGNEEFDDDDMEKLPLDLQYLGSDKLREENSKIRCMLLETLMQLCTKRTNRIKIRNMNTYVILREYHKWERDEHNLTICEDLVNILIRTEDEIGVENLSDVKMMNRNT